MKTLSLLFFLIPFVSIAQNQEEQFIEQLVKDKFISESEAKRVSLDSTLVSLYDVYLARMGRKRGEGRGDMLGSSWSYVMDDNYFTRLKLFLKHLREFDIIGKQACTDLYKKIKHTEAFQLEKKERFSYDYRGLMQTESEIMQYVYEWHVMQANKALIGSYAKELEGLGLIEDASKIKANEVHGKIDVLKHFKKHLYIAGDEFPEDVCEAYRYAYKKLEGLHPDFVVSELTCEERHIVEDDYESDRIYVSFKHQQRVFNEAFYYIKDKSEWGPRDGLVSDRIAMVFNLTLINSDAPYRVLEVEGMGGGAIGFVLVNKTQAEFMKFDYKSARNYNFKYFSPDFYKPEIGLYKEFEYLKRDAITQYFLLLDSLNFYRNMPQITKDSLLGELQNAFIESSEDLFYMSCPNQMYFDWEMWPYVTPYVTATKEFSAITFGDFSPTNIKDDFNIEAEYCHFEFTFKGKRYAKKLKVGGDWFDPDFLEMIEQAMEENDLPGKFYDLPDGGQASGHVYLSPVQYQYLVKYKFIEFWTNPFED